jgi:hypothetical protein
MIGVSFLLFPKRVWRTTELRVEKITLDSEAQRFIDEMGAAVANAIAGNHRIAMVERS